MYSGVLQPSNHERYTKHSGEIYCRNGLTVILSAATVMQGVATNSKHLSWDTKLQTVRRKKNDIKTFTWTERDNWPLLEWQIQSYSNWQLRSKNIRHHWYHVMVMIFVSRWWHGLHNQTVYPHYMITWINTTWFN